MLDRDTGIPQPRETLSAKSAVERVRAADLTKLTEPGLLPGTDVQVLRSILQSTNSVALETTPRYFFNEQTGQKALARTERKKFIFRDEKGGNVAHSFYLNIAAAIASKIHAETGAYVYTAGSMRSRQTTFPVSEHLEVPPGYAYDNERHLFVRADGGSEIDTISDMDLIITNIGKTDFVRLVYQPTVTHLQRLYAALPPEVTFDVKDSTPVWRENVARSEVVALGPW